MKSATKKRPSFLPDHALNSPLISSCKVELRSLRPTENNTSNGYPVPIRATPGNAYTGGVSVTHKLVRIVRNMKLC